MPDGNVRALTVVATTTMLADMAQIIAGDALDVIHLMGPGTDPHLYKPTPKDAAHLANATLVLFNGLRLEGKMIGFLENLRLQGHAIHAISSSIKTEDYLYPSEFAGHPDPHIWLDPVLWKQCVPGIVRALTEVAPEHTAAFKERGHALEMDLDTLHEWAQQQLAQIPTQGRILITSHDAFNYFGRAYDLEVVAVQGISTVTEAGLADITRVVDLIQLKRIPAIFIESSVSPAAIKRISKDSGAVVGGELYSDSTGIPGSMRTDPEGVTYDLGTYAGMFRHNVLTITQALTP